MTQPREGFSIVMTGAEIRAHIERHAAQYEAEARRIEEDIEKAKKEVHEGIDRHFEEIPPIATPMHPGFHHHHRDHAIQVSEIDSLATQRKTLVEAARRHRQLAAHIEHDATFRLDKGDITFLGLLNTRSGHHYAMIPGAGLL